MKVLIDTNVVIDWLSKRQPFVSVARRIVDLVESGRIDGYVTASSVTDIFYLSKKSHSYDEAIEGVRKVLTVFEIADTTKSILLSAILSSTHDFEDAVQTETARKISAEYIITRNTQDFLLSPIPVLSPDDFWEVLSANTSKE
ncbi:DNA-binding protein [Bacteroidia bacterium]|nr:DNA-binding protein [Bacteroidia bacterium]